MRNWEYFFAAERIQSGSREEIISTFRIGEPRQRPSHLSAKDLSPQVSKASTYTYALSFYVFLCTAVFNIRIFNNEPTIAFENRYELIIIETKPLEQPENEKFLIGFLGGLINIRIPLKIMLKP